VNTGFKPVPILQSFPHHPPQSFPSHEIYLFNTPAVPFQTQHTNSLRFHPYSLSSPYPPPSRVLPPLLLPAQPLIGGCLRAIGCTAESSRHAHHRRPPLPPELSYAASHGAAALELSRAASHGAVVPAIATRGSLAAGLRSSLSLVHRRPPEAHPPPVSTRPRVLSAAGHPRLARRRPPLVPGVPASLPMEAAFAYSL
jgi:hypothetical protein